MSNFLFLTHRMSMGFGVAVVVDTLSRKLTEFGHHVIIGTPVYDYEIPNVVITQTDANVQSVRELARENHVDIIIAHTSPFFEILPDLEGEFRCWAYEHGDPSPDFFINDKDERRRIVENKIHSVYPSISGVIAISEFIKNDIHWPSAHVIYNGSDHILDRGSKSYVNFIDKKRALKIGTLMRLGQGEALYKGNTEFINLCKKIKSLNLNVTMYVMGRGTKNDASFFEKNDISVFLNATDEDRSKYLRDLDIFISPSLWEGFNLPLVEAMRNGTLAMAFDTGAHPEVTPFIYSSVDEMVVAIKNYEQNRNLLFKDSKRCHSFVSQKFNWTLSVSNLLKTLFLNNQFSASPATTLSSEKKGSLKKPSTNNFLKKLHTAFLLYKKNGIRAVLTRIKEKLKSRIHKK